MTVLEYLHKPAPAVELAHPADYVMASAAAASDAGSPSGASLRVPRSAPTRSRPYAGWSSS